MKPIPVIAVFDIGKTNKKIFLFDEQYRIVFERSARFIETEDEDGFPCENLESLKNSVYDSLNEVSKLKEFELKAVNFSAYGASFVYLDDNGQSVAPLYNYLKPYPEYLKKQFYDTYCSEAMLSAETASPVSGSLNSGLQLYRIKYERPDLFSKIKYALHLPQYLSYLVTGEMCSDVTSIGCHTALWNYKLKKYHLWVNKEEITIKLAPILKADTVFNSCIQGTTYKAGIGLHDSSAALIPYLVSFKEPFILISTGTWAISLNPFNQSSLTEEELANDCLNYIQCNGRPVKASRLFSGHEYEQQIKRIASHFNQDVIKYRGLPYDDQMKPEADDQTSANIRRFSDIHLDRFKNDVDAYYQLMDNIVRQQKKSTNYILQDSPVKRIFVDGGFSKNAIFMNLLADAFPNIEVYAANMAQATALGTALVIHDKWNNNPVPNDLIELRYYTAKPGLV